ncbi:MAG TPA: BTAD domain-containing putative transcriptional regulator [Actinomycetes bacterium]|nr:BTAD domain-containing putative transcriptional regulator [Actinomycetes bacterium]
MVIDAVGYLGPLEVRVDGQQVGVPGQRLRLLLLRLAVAAGRPVSSTDLVDTVWEEEPPADPANALQSLVSRLRRTLGGAGTVEQGPGGGYRLVVDPGEVDAVRFARLAAEGRGLLRDGAYDDGARVLSEALALWRGEPLADDPSPAADSERTGLAELRLQVQRDLAESEVRVGGAAEVLPQLEALVADHPLREDLVLVQMEALATDGRPAEALAAYERLRRELAESLGADPSPALRARHLELLRLPDGSLVPPTNLRAAVTSFVGRDDDVRAVASRLGSGRLVTVVGAGGAGKTRLATEVAAGVVAGGPPTAPDGVWFVELAPVSDPADLPAAVLGGMDVRDVALFEQHADRPPRDPRTRVIDVLTEARALLVLDNCEHLVDAAADIVAEVLARCPGVRVLATSREPLGIDGEVLYPLAPLAADPAIRLLLDRALAAGAEIVRDESTTGPVTEIVRRLDGLPLAIELAAARLRVLSPAEVADRLSDRFRLLTGGRRTAVPRHRTLRAVVEWSWDLLSDVEREVAEHFTVLGSGADIAAVAAVCPTWRAAAGTTDAPEVTDVLQALVDKSMLVAERDGGATRYRMLETLREYGAERLAEQGTLDVARDAHARYYAAVTVRADRGLRSDRQTGALRLLDLERDNVLTALGWLGGSGDAASALDLAVHLGWYWLLRENGEDARRWLGFAMAVPGADALDAYPLADALRTLGSIVTVGDDDTSAQDRSVELVALAQGVSAVQTSYPLARVLAPLLLFFAEARVAALAGMEMAMADPDPWVRAAARMVRVALAENEGDLGTVRAEVETALTEWRTIGDSWGLAAVLTTRGQLRTFEGDLLGAAEDYEEASANTRALGGTTDDMLVTMRMADLRLRADDVAGAKRHLATMRASRAYAAGPMMRNVLIDVTAVAIAVAEHDDDTLRATQDTLLAAMDTGAEPTHFQAHGAAVGWAAVAEVEVRLGDVATAQGYAATAYRMAVMTNDLPIVAVTGIATAAVAAAMGQYSDAAELIGAASRLRGSDDPTQPMIAQLVERVREQLGTAAYEKPLAVGRAMDRAEAVARLDPATLRAAAPAGPAGQAGRR